tara:strand:+ start:202 stop:399 length:198 start_codon:yes stop_codon:yes gene_type:complete
MDCDVFLPSVRCEKTQRGNHEREAVAPVEQHDKQHAALHVGERAGENAHATWPLRGFVPCASHVV